jgi:hypothetical protein
LVYPAPLHNTAFDARWSIFVALFLNFTAGHQKVPTLPVSENSAPDLRTPKTGRVNAVFKSTLSSTQIEHIAAIHGLGVFPKVTARSGKALEQEE